MFNTVLEKFSGVFSRSFIHCCWFPSFTAAIISLLVYYFPFGYVVPVMTWGAWSVPKQIFVLVTFLLLITLIAYIVHGVSYYLMRIFEGYWPKWLRQLFQKRVIKKWKKLCDARRIEAEKGSDRYSSLQARIYFGYPAEEKFFLPTCFGNIIRSAEMYPRTIYGLDGVFWWPRLFPLIPEVIQDNLNENLIAMITLIHFSCLSFFLGVFSFFHFFCQGEFYFGRQTPRGWIAWGIFIALSLFSWLAYKGIMAKANSYGLLIRSSYDLYRFQLLSALNFDLPRTPLEEKDIWSNLENWLYNFNFRSASELEYKAIEKRT
ncbi:MAG: hypothetical protein ABII93_03770 [Chrysiogenia bacterium]